jgi:hypothetical protein
MPTTYSPSLRLELIGAGEQSGTWGNTTNTNLGTLIEQAIVGVAPITMVNANYTLSNNQGLSDEARQAVIVATGTNAAIRDIIAPLVKKSYTIRNNTTGGFAINIRAATGASVSVANGATSIVYCDGTNFNLVVTNSTSNSNASAITYTPAGAGAVDTTVQAKFRETVSVFDFMSPAQVVEVQNNTPATVGASADCYLAFQTATTYLENNVFGGVLFIPRGLYKVSGGTISNDRSLTPTKGRVSYQGADENSTGIVYSGPGNSCFYFANTHPTVPGAGAEPSASYQRISDLTIIGPISALTTTATNNCFTTTNASTTVVVNILAHGATNNSYVIFSGATATGGVSAVTLNSKYLLTYINANSFSIVVPSAATSSVTGGGTAIVALFTLRSGSTGVTMNLGAFAKFERLNIQAFDIGMYLQDVDQAYFEKLNVRFNNQGVWGLKSGSPPSGGGASTQPNNWTFESCSLSNNFLYGANIIGGSALTFVGGDVEYNGSVAGAAGFGLQFLNSGYEGGVGAVLQGVYFEGNRGLADVVLIGIETVYGPILGVTHIITGCSFNRNGAADTANINNILCNFGPPSTVGQQQLILQGCGFKPFNTYVPSAGTPVIAYGITPATNGVNFFDLGSLYVSSVEKPAFATSTYVTAGGDNTFSGTNTFNKPSTGATNAITVGVPLLVNSGVTAGRLTSVTDNSAYAAGFGTVAGSTAAAAMVVAVHSNAVALIAFASGAYPLFQTAGSITSGGLSVSYNTSSDYRLKQNVVPIANASARLNTLNPIRFDWVSDVTHNTVDGFLAHEVQAVIPEAVVGVKDEVDAEGIPKYQGIDQSKLVPLLVASLQEALARITALEAK